MASDSKGAQAAPGGAPSATPETASQRPSLRSDLTIEHEPADGSVRITDPATGRQYNFSAEEHFLCMATDGVTSVAAMREAFKARFGKDIDTAAIYALHRRLRVAGLLTRAEAGRPAPAQGPAAVSAPPAADADDAPGRREALRARLADEKTAAEKAPPPSGQRIVPRVLPKRATPGAATPHAAAGETPVAAPLQAGSSPPPETTAPAAGMPPGGTTDPGIDLADIEDVIVGPEAAARMAAQPARAPLPLGQPGRPPAPRVIPNLAGHAAAAERLAARKTAAEAHRAAPPAGAGEPGANAEPAPDTTPADKGAPSESTEPSTASAARTPGPDDRDAEAMFAGLDLAQPAENTGSQPARADETSRAPVRVTPPTARPGAGKPDVGRMGARARRRAEEEAAPRPAGPAAAARTFDTDAFFTEPGEDDTPAGPGARFGRAGRGGGAGPGMAGPGMAGAGAGFGGGGFGGGGGMGGGGMGGGGMGGRGQALLAALAERARDREHHHPNDRVSFFNPNGLFWATSILFWPMRYLGWLLWPLVAFACLIVFQRWSDFAHDVLVSTFEWSTIAVGLISLLVVSFLARVAQGTAIRSHGGQVRQFGIVIEMGVLPRFFVDRTDIPKLTRNGQLHAYAAPLLARLWLWAGGIFIWATQRGTGTQLADYSLVVSHAALVEFIFVAFPLLPTDGMNWLSVWFNDPNLKQKAIGSAMAWFQGRPRPFMVRPEEERGLILFGVGTLIWSVTFVAGFVTYLGIILQKSLGGAGVFIFLGLIVLALLWVYGVVTAAKKNAPGAALAFALESVGSAGAPAAARGRLGKADAEDKLAKPRASIAAWGRVIWAFVLVFLLGVAFLPYNYETSGLFEILPNTRNQETAQTDGAIAKILVREGDWVEAGQLLGQLTSFDQEHDVAVTAARLAEAKAKLAKLKDGAKPEEITVAEKRVEASRASVAFSKAEMEREQQLLKTGTSSQARYDRAKTAYDSDIAQLEVSVANLELVKSSATQNEIDAMQADVDRLAAELKYREDQLERTRIRASEAGRVITPNLHLLVGKWLRSGQALLETENAKSVDAEIAVPESDIALVSPGDKVRIKAWGYSDREIPGTVTSIAPAAEERSYGMIVRTKATIQNEDGALKSSMTGYAKVDGAPMMTWEAFLRWLVRFFQVEVWSWIP
ncbi:HlyD family efflux transporter periplasmic adaptor subunit [Bosea sp. 117]|uniref:HlyD family efflux transporter periplasmic adaptor subunit n=1 Tax=Bosea sp. 117 TaxID=1125973 RepID=UPI0004944354|nr:HlyD family efflux transporter periplasmic adaptor subunit [Bosea sp. 117]